MKRRRSPKTSGRSDGQDLVTDLGKGVRGTLERVPRGMLVPFTAGMGSRQVPVGCLHRGIPSAVRYDSLGPRRQISTGDVDWETSKGNGSRSQVCG